MRDSYRNSSLRCFWLGMVACAALTASGDQPSERTRESILAALDPLSHLVGEWRGIAQPRRGSSAGAWKEGQSVAWSWQPDRTGLRWAIKESELWTTALVSPGEKADELTLLVTRPDESTLILKGKLDGKKAVFESDPDDNDQIQRITLTLLNGDRVIWLHERRRDGQSFTARIAEIGTQREGTRLATSSSDGPECVVTGGKGTIPVMHAGKTYYVCCTGCRDAFNDDPEGILAEWNAKREKAKSSN